MSSHPCVTLLSYCKILIFVVQLYNFVHNMRTSKNMITSNNNLSHSIMINDHVSNSLFTIFKTSFKGAEVGTLSLNHVK